MEFLKVDVDNQGIATVTFDRPPVNAVSNQVFMELGQLGDMISASEDVKVVVIVRSPRSRAWCGGVELKDMAPLDGEGRKKRFEMLKDTLPRFYRLNRPVIAAMDANTVGIGVILASLCDIRVAADDIFLAFPEIDRGLVVAGGGFGLRVNFPAGKLREMIYTGLRYPSRDLRYTAFLDYIVPRDQVVPKAMELARVMASKSLSALRANKECNNESERLDWEEGYILGQKYSAVLGEGHDSREGIKAFLEKRAPEFKDK